MRKSVLIILMLVLAVGVPGIAKSDCQEEVIWQIGKRDGEDVVDPSDGAKEYPENGFQDEVRYTVGDDLDPINEPSIPGYFAFNDVCAIDPDTQFCTYSSAELYIDFSLTRDYDDGELSFVYGRYGSEEDELYLEGLIVQVKGTGEGFQEFTIPLTGLQAGNILFIISYIGSELSGHYIDYLKLVVTPDNCVKTVAVDIKPQSCPNPLNVKSKGVLPVALLGTGDFDVSEVDIETLALDGVPPIRSAYEDVATPFTPTSEKEDCFYDCDELGPDGFLDLTLKFDTQEVVAALGKPVDGACLTLHLTGSLLDGNPIEGEDVVLILDKPNSNVNQEKKGKQ